MKMPLHNISNNNVFLPVNVVDINLKLMEINMPSFGVKILTLDPINTVATDQVWVELFQLCGPQFVRATTLSSLLILNLRKKGNTYHNLNTRLGLRRN